MTGVVKGPNLDLHHLTWSWYKAEKGAGDASSL